MRDAGPRNLHSPLAWTPEASTAFALLTTDLSAAAALTAPDYKNKVHLDVSEKEGFTSSILLTKDPPKGLAHLVAPSHENEKYD